MQTQFARIDDHNFEELKAAHPYLLIVFSSPDCGYCKLAKNNLLEIIDQLNGVSAFECNVGDAPRLVDRFAVSSVPVFKLIKDGSPIYTGFGVRTPTDLYYQLKSFLPTDRDSYFLNN